MRRFNWLAVCFFSFSLAVSAEVWYTDINGIASNPDGRSWDTAFYSIQQAIDAAAVAGGDVWIAGGTYFEAIVLKSNVRLYGGFRRGDSAMEQRDPKRHETVVDGRFAYSSGVSSRVVSIENTTNTRVDGFTIAGGRIGVFLHNADDSNCIASCVFKNGYTRAREAAVLSTDSAAVLQDCLITEDSITAAVNAATGMLSLKRCTIVGSNASGVYGRVNMSDCIICGNSTGIDGTAVTLTRCVVSGNYADGVRYSESLMAENCIMSGNGASAIRSDTDGASAILLHCSIARNRRAGISAKAVTAAGTVFTGHTMSAVHAPVAEFRNCLFHANGLAYGSPSGLVCADAADVNAQLSGSSGNLDGDPLFSMHGPNALRGVWTAPSVYDANLNRTTLTAAEGTFEPGGLVGRLVMVEPSGFHVLVVENSDAELTVYGRASIFDSRGGFVLADYHLLPASPCIDAATGEPESVADFDGIPRPLGGFPDVGAYEFHTDSDGDGIPDFTEGWGDPDGDGTPNSTDPDSDGDGLADASEGALDVDRDAVPNFLDADSDADGLPDAAEGEADPDGNGIPAFLDADRDGDGIQDSIEGPGDADGDGQPNCFDLDSDADGVEDEDEGVSDDDGDGLPLFLDTDQDNDGIDDAEDGDDDPDTDGLPNYLDPDSDDDGLLDLHETTADPDADGQPNYLDLDRDDDGTADADEPPRFYVNAKYGTDGNSGLSWNCAFRHVQAGVDAAFAAGGGEVWVAEGEYRETVSLRSGVSVYGGFAGAEWSLRERILEANPCTLRPPVGGSRLSLAQIAILVEVSNVRLDGFTLTGASSQYDDEAVIFCWYADGPICIANCVLRGNSSTPIFSAHSVTVFEDCRIEDNVCQRAMRLSGRDALTLRRCTLARNSGAGINGDSVDLIACTVVENGGTGIDVADLRAEGCVVERNRNFGIYANHLRMSNCTVSANSNWGAYVAYDADIRRSVVQRNGKGVKLAWGEMQDCLVIGNTGTGVEVWRDDSRIVGCTISGNGEGILCSGGSLSVINTILAVHAGAAMKEAGPHADIYPSHCLFSDNAVDFLNEGNEPLTTVNQVGLAPDISPANFSGEPLFMDALAGDYRLLNGSAALDRGDLEYATGADLAGEARPGGDGQSDIGAYEAPAAYLPPPDLSAPVSALEVSRLSGQRIVDVLCRAADGQGPVACVELYYRRNGGPWTRYPGTFAPGVIRFNTSITGGDGAYDFYAIAVDAAGNRQLSGMASAGSTRVLARLSGPRIYANSNASGPGFGTSWSSAFRSVQDAVVIAAGNGIPEVWVAEGIYREPVHLASHVAIYGGFAGTETRRDDRDPSAHPTRLDRHGADGRRRPGNAVVGVGISGALLDGFIVTGAAGLAQYAEVYREFANPAYNPGGALYLERLDGTVRIVNCTIEDNSAPRGGGICCSSASPRIEACRILSNSAQLGGGVYCEVFPVSGQNTPSEPVFVDCIFKDCRAESTGGGVCLDRSGGTFQRCLFSGNAVNHYSCYSEDTDQGGGLCAYAWLRQGEDPGPIPVTELVSCTFTGNLAVVGGGAAAVGGGSIRALSCVFERNQAGIGGGVALHGRASSMTNCGFRGNTVVQNTCGPQAEGGTGGGVSAYSEDTISYCTVEENTADRYGGGAFGGHYEQCKFLRNTSDGSGGGLYGGAAVACTFVQNRAQGEGGGSYGFAPDSCLYLENEAEGAGGGAVTMAYYAFPYIYCVQGPLTNCLFIRNRAARGAAWWAQGLTEYGGEGVYNVHVPTSAVCCTFVGNVATNGSSLGSNSSYTHPMLVNSIHWGNSPGELAVPASYSIVEGACQGEGVVRKMPRFVNADANNYQLRPDSPGVNQGTATGAPLVDIGGTHRPQGNGIDMGAYETPVVDVDGSGSVNAVDVQRVILCALGLRPTEDGDLDGDGRADARDVQLIINWVLNLY